MVQTSYRPASYRPARMVPSCSTCAYVRSSKHKGDVAPRFYCASETYVIDSERNEVDAKGVCNKWEASASTLSEIKSKTTKHNRNILRVGDMVKIGKYWGYVDESEDYEDAYFILFEPIGVLDRGTICDRIFNKFTTDRFSFQYKVLGYCDNDDLSQFPECVTLEDLTLFVACIKEELKTIKEKKR